jgi:excisionase family DNA binding protein
MSSAYSRPHGGDSENLTAGVTAPLPVALSPRQLAKCWGVSKDKVLGWIHTGLLRAIDVRSANSSRPQYRIPGDAVQAFSAARSNSTPPNGPRTERKGGNPARPPPKIKYF